MPARVVKLEKGKHSGKKKKEEIEEDTATRVKKNKVKLSKKNKKISEEYPVVEVLPSFSTFKTEGISIELSKKIPKITAKEYEVMEVMPEFTKYDETIEIKLSKEMPDFSEYAFKYPLIHARPRFEEIDVNELKIKVNKKLPVLDKTVMYPLIFPRVNFDYSLSPETIEILVDEELPEKIRNVPIPVKLRFGNEKIQGVSEMSKESEGKKLETIEDFMDEELKKKWSGMGLVSGERPVLIWVEQEIEKSLSIGDIKEEKKTSEKTKDILPLVKILAREMYRIKTGGFPKSYHYSVITAPSYSGIDDITADKSIFVITSNILKEIFEDSGKDGIKKRELFLSKLESIYSQKGGFLIIEKDKETVPVLPVKNSSYKEIDVSPDKLPLDAAEFGELMGFIGREDGEKEPSITYGNVDKLYQDELENLATHSKYVPFVKPSNGDESLLHYALKVFTYRYLRENKKIDARKIETEYSINGGNYIPDVIVTSSSTVYEIEALYGKGYTIASHLYDKVKKASENKIKTVHFVFSPLHYLILGKSIIKYLIEIKNEFPEINIAIDIPSFKTKDFHTKAILH